MKLLLLILVCFFGIVATSVESDGQEVPITLDAARELGRSRSRFLTADKPKTLDAIPTANVADFTKSVAPVFKKSCLGCHGPEKTEGRLRIDQLDPDMLKGTDVERWREVYNALIKAEMPPEDASQYALAEADRVYMIEWLSGELDKASIIRRNNQDHSSFRRLTKYEYNYALQDLLGLPHTLASKLPPETASEDGFKNRSDLLQMSVMQFESYREIGLKALKRATVSGDRPQPVIYVISMQDEMKIALSGSEPKVFDANDEGYKKHRNQRHLLDRETGKGLQISGAKPLPRSDANRDEVLAISPVVLVLPRSSELKLDLDRFLPDDGVMRVRIRAARSNMNPDEYASLRLIFSAHTSNNANFSQTISERDIPVTAPSDDPQYLNFDIPLSDIQRNPFRKLATTFPRRDEFLHIQNVSNAFGGENRLQVLIDRIEVIAPFYEQWPPKTHTDIFIESPNKNDEQVYGREVLNRFLKRVWRRPVTPQEVDQFMTLFAKYRPGLATFEDAMVEVLATALATPEFLYLTQRVVGESTPSTTRISDYEFASRLSTFLWASVPDEELMQLAESGRIRHSQVLPTQIKRMLADPRSRRFSQNFVEQWLGLDRINSVTHVTDESLRESMLQEPVAFFESVLNSDSSIIDFIDAGYVLINERLAAHYQIPKVYGPHFRKVPIDRQSHRGGLLTGSAVLTMNSDGKDSHPVKRGVWLLQRILHDPPPPPPPNVPEVDLTDPEILKMTLKERIVNHRNKPACASCHSRIDPWGIAFENYDALGAYRTHIKNQPIDASSELFNRQLLTGMDGLKRYLLLERQDQFARAMVHKVTAYALGRPLTFGDRVDIDHLTAQLRRRNDRLNDLIILIAGSEIFSSR